MGKYFKQAVLVLDESRVSGVRGEQSVLATVWDIVGGGQRTVKVEIRDWINGKDEGSLCWSPGNPIPDLPFDGDEFSW